jgi:ubiquinone biosynthesis protein UbiJ
MLAKLKLLPQKILTQSVRCSNQMLACYLNQDPEYYHDLTMLAGKKISFYVEDFNLTIALNFTRTQMLLNYQKIIATPLLIDENNLTLQGKSSALLAFALRKTARSKLLSQKAVIFQGDLFLLEAVVKLLSQREVLANLPLPPGVKHLLIFSSKRLVSWQKHNAQVLQHTFIDYVQEELKLLPSYKHFELLQAELLELEESLDRLEAKFNFLVEV